MNWKKNIFFIVSSVVVVLLLVFSGIKLGASTKRFKEQKLALQHTMSRWQQLHNRNPHPSAENVRREQENVETLTNVHSTLLQTLQRGQVDEVEMEAADFMPLLENTLRRLRGTMEEARIILPEGFSFGFEQYAGGQLPAPNDIPRLVQQLKIIEILCSVLPEAKITELVSVSREVFEMTTKEPVRTGRRGEPVAPRRPTPGVVETQTDDACATQIFKLSFRAREHAVFDVMNRLARNPMFVVITSLELKDVGQPIRGQVATRSRALQKQPETTGKEDGKTKDQRIITRKEEIEVEMIFDVYRF